MLGSMALPSTTASAAVTGGQHSRLALSDEAYLWAVAVMSARNAWAVGADLVAPDTQFSAPLLAHWDGRSWTEITSGALPLHGYLTGITTFKGGAWAVGASGTHPNGTPGLHKPLIMRLTGSSWTRAPYSNKSGGHLTAVAASSPANAWAVGSVMDDAGDGAQLIVHWNGWTWKRVPSPSPGGGPTTGPVVGPDNRLAAVSATSATSAWAVGWGSTRGLVYAPVILRWNGRSWKHVHAPDPSGGGFLDGIWIGPSGRAWAVGYTEDQLLPLLEHWDGSAWH